MSSKTWKGPHCDFSLKKKKSSGLYFIAWVSSLTDGFESYTGTLFWDIVLVTSPDHLFEQQLLYLKDHGMGESVSVAEKKYTVHPS